MGCPSGVHSVQHLQFRLDRWGRCWTTLTGHEAGVTRNFPAVLSREKHLILPHLLPLFFLKITTHI